jgi:hypothetical protein
MGGATLQIPNLDVTTVQSAGVSPFFGAVQMYWTAEAQTRTETEPEFKQMERMVTGKVGTLFGEVGIWRGWNSPPGNEVTWSPPITCEPTSSPANHARKGNPANKQLAWHG